MKVLVLGGTGVIGGQIVSTLISSGLDVTAISRGIISNSHTKTSGNFIKLDLVGANDSELLSLISQFTIVINAAGVIKQRISSTDFSTHLEAVNLNTLLPIRLAALSNSTSIKVINITTDCVFDGLTGNYDETHSHSAPDIYGKSKSLGEVQASNFFNLRCSVIGPDTTSLSLAGWVLHQDPNSKITGYLNHSWNGITTYSLSKIILGIVESGFWYSGTQHLVPSNSWTKFQLVQELIQVCNRLDLTLEKGSSRQGINRILQTVNPEQNSILWKLAGYSQSPSLRELFQESTFRTSFQF